VKAQPAAATRAQARVDDARISPVVRKMADEYKLDLSLNQGTGDGGRITKKDVQAFLARPSDASRATGATAAPRTAAAPAAGDEVVPFTRRRRVIAERMSQSRRTIPEVTTFSEVDMSRVALVRARYKAQAGKTPGAPKLTYLPFICAAAVRALREYPIVNAQIVSTTGAAEDAYVLKADINLGVAVDTDEGLIVPVIRHADELSLLGLARATDALGEKGRTGKITPDEMAGGTFTISNPGLKGNLFGTPIINLPQVGCLRMGEVVKRAVVIEREGEDTIAIRPMMYLAFAYDHRIVDGVPGNAFLHRVTELLEAGDFPL
jgi:2-oxoglutarate dehydrogenase E2 component (dihydrolipoamide succinyltransferase)